jgi:type IV secretion system protein VirD4
MSRIPKSWLALVAWPLLLWASYVAFQAQWHAAGAISRLHPPLWALLLWGVTLLDSVYAYARYQGWQAHRQRSTTRGSAHWAMGRELAPYRARKDEAALVLGNAGSTPLALSEQRQCEHIALVAPQGKGKTALVIAPGLLREPGRRSLVVIDPKSELVRLTAGAVAERHQVWILSPDAPAESVSYNPLAHLHTFEDAQDFAQCWVQNTGTSHPFYDKTAELLITGTAWHLRETEPAAPLARLAELLVHQTFDELCDQLLGSPAVAARELVASQLRDFQKHAQLQASVRAGLATRFLLLSSPNVRAVTDSNRVDFAEMVEQPTALYLAIPSSASERLRPLSACLLMQMFATWIRLAEAHDGQLPRQVMCYLDEFGNAGVIPHFAERIATLRSFRVALLLAIQSFAQLHRLYGRDTTSIILANAATHLVLRGIGQEEAEFYSKRIGETTLRSQSQSGTGLVSVQEIARPLIRPEEIRTMPEHQLLALADHAHPVRVRARPYYRDPLVAARANWPLPGMVAAPFQFSTTGEADPDAVDPEALTVPGIPLAPATGQPWWQRLLHRFAPFLLLALVLAGLAGCGSPSSPSHAAQHRAASTPLLVVSERVTQGTVVVPQVAAYQQGHLRWAYRLSAPGEVLMAASGIVYVGAGSQMLAIETSTGKVRWTASASQEVRAIRVIEGQVYVDTGGGFAGAEQIEVFSQAGQRRWQYTPPAFQDIPAWLVDAGVFYTVVSGFPATLLALDATTGTQRWQFPLHLDAPVRSLVPAGPAALLVVTQDRLVLDQRSGGAEDWQRDQTLVVAPLVSAGVVYAFFVDQPVTPEGLPQPVLRALRLTDGSVLWQQSLPASDAGFLATASPLLVGGITAQAAWLADGADFTTARVWNVADGHLRWTYQARERIVSLISDGQMLYLATAAQLLALQATNGQPRWQQPNAARLTWLDEQAGVLIGRNTLTNTLAGYEPTTGQQQWLLHPHVLDQTLIL